MPRSLDEIDPENVDAIGDVVKVAIIPLLKARAEGGVTRAERANDREYALALVLIAAHHLMHADEDEDFLIAVARAAWNRSEREHRAHCRPKKGKRS